MGAIGDSLTTGFAAGDNEVDNAQFSFAVGTEILSHLGRLTAMNDGITAVHLAKKGTKLGKLVEKKTMPDGTPIPNQIDLLPRDAKYVTISVGSSDLCANTATPTGQFSNNAAELFRQLKARLGPANVVILAVPDWYGIWNKFKNDQEMLDRWENACPPLFQAGNEDARQAIDTRTRSYNGLLASACSLSNTRSFRCFFASGVFEINWTKGDLSAFDGFHPSASGQAKLSKAAWKVSPYRLRAWGLVFDRRLAFSRKTEQLRLDLLTAPHATVRVRVTTLGGRLLASDTYQASDSGAVTDLMRVRAWSGEDAIRVKFTITLNDEKMTVKRKVNT